MKALHRRLQRLEQRAEALSASRPDPLPDDDAFAAWCRGGGVGPLPLAGPRPAKYPSEEEWQQQHRFLRTLCCRSVGQPDPPEMTEDERREADEAIAFFASIDPSGQLSLPQRARLAPYRAVIARFGSAAGGGAASPASGRGASP